jgi:hypothetical protein
MRIRWENVIPLTVIIVLTVLLIELRPLLRRLAREIGTLTGRSGDPIIGLLALAVLCLAVVCVLYIISKSRR